MYSQLSRLQSNLSLQQSLSVETASRIVEPIPRFLSSFHTSCCWLVIAVSLLSLGGRGLQMLLHNASLREVEQTVTSLFLINKHVDTTSIQSASVSVHAGGHRPLIPEWSRYICRVLVVILASDSWTVTKHLQHFIQSQHFSWILLPLAGSYLLHRRLARFTGVESDRSGFCYQILKDS